MSKPLSGSDIRRSFIDFFVSKGHTFVPSASLVPGDDQTLLFTNAGMVQFKEIFLGTEKRSYHRAVNSQKCMRVAGKHNDLDDVGRDDTHHTFFEMLGNWSFGDYYKKEAISWAWELLTEKWGLSKSRFWVTCFKDEILQIPTDDKAADIWREQDGINPDHILFFGRKDNFWEMADTGPCGPCSEIHYDLGKEHCNLTHVDGHVCGVNGDCERFLELWNLVFIQYNRLSERRLEPLPAKHVDTGMGFERIVSILQGEKSNYSTDLLNPIMDAVQDIAAHSRKEREANITPYRVITDHVRTAAFLIADGVVPGNIGRNYVARMIIRRAALFGSKIGLDEPFLYKLVNVVVENYGDAYKELQRNQQTIKNQILLEENRFKRTVESGLAHLGNALEYLEVQNTRILPGGIAFELYTTHGLPLEITRDLAREKGIEVDDAGYKEAFESHRILSGAGKSMAIMDGGQTEFYARILEDLIDKGSLGSNGVTYDPYTSLAIAGEVLALIEEGNVVEHAGVNANVEIVIPQSPFYLESGGQVSDTGVIYSKSGGWTIRIMNSFRPVTGLIVLKGVVTEGWPRINDECVAEVNRERRQDIMRNHTATHLLHSALHSIIGKHAVQSGSLVAPDYLRFDFNHPEALTQEQLDEIESFVNKEVLADHRLTVKFQSLDQAIHDGAVALFGEKYGESVRTVRIIDEDKPISFELCGGTHVESTADIGTFLITNEGSVASGIRRIEAVSGRGAYQLIREMKQSMKQTAKIFNTPFQEVPEKAKSILWSHDNLQKQIVSLQEDLSRIDFVHQLNNVKKIDEIHVLTSVINNTPVEALRKLTDEFKVKYPTGVIVLGSIINDRPILIAAITEDLIERGLNAVDLVKFISKEIGGGGGGKPTLAQAGGKFGHKINQALSLVEEYIRKK